MENPPRIFPPIPPFCRIAPSLPCFITGGQKKSWSIPSHGVMSGFRTPRWRKKWTNGMMWAAEKLSKQRVASLEHLAFGRCFPGAWWTWTAVGKDEQKMNKRHSLAKGPLVPWCICFANWCFVLGLFSDRIMCHSVCSACLFDFVCVCVCLILFVCVCCSYSLCVIFFFMFLLLFILRLRLLLTIIFLLYFLLLLLLFLFHMNHMIIVMICHYYV